MSKNSSSSGLMIDIHLSGKAEKALFALHAKKLAESNQYDFCLEKDDYKRDVLYALPPQIEYRMQKFKPRTMVVFDVDAWERNRGTPIHPKLLQSIVEKGCMVLVLHVNDSPSTFLISDRQRFFDWNFIMELLKPLPVKHIIDP